MSKKQSVPEGTEEKILSAARKVFLRKGYAASRTRDIADEAGINLALLNYYFRSKEKLFEIVMLENLKQFMGGVVFIINDESTSFGQKIQRIVNQYIDNLSSTPDLPVFVLSELRNHPEIIIKMVNAENKFIHSVLITQYNELVKKKKVRKMQPLHLLANIISLSVFPFVAEPVLKNISNVSSDEYRELMQERKKLIPEWIMLMLTIK